MGHILLRMLYGIAELAIRVGDSTDAECGRRV